MPNMGSQMDEYVPLPKGMFVGDYEHSLDPKKRITIPSKWRDSVGEPHQLFVFPDPNSKLCLLIYPVREVMPRLNRLRQLSIADPKAQAMSRALGANSDMLNWDSQWRIRIKDQHLAFANIEQKVVLLGAIDHFELWDPNIYKEQVKTGDLSNMAEAMTGIGF